MPWLAALDRARSLRGAVAIGLAMACVFELAVFGWFARAIETYTGLPWIGALLLLLAFGPLLQPQFVAAAAARHLTRAGAGGGRRVWMPAVVGAAAYVGTEWAIPKLFADTLGHGLYPSVWLRQAADVAGAHGLTFALLLANESILALATAPASDRGGWGRRRLGPGGGRGPRRAARATPARSARVPALGVVRDRRGARRSTASSAVT